jgi:DEAD/DEAH box helicase domain-containing protein
VPEPEERPTIAAIVKEIIDQPWYKEQIIHRQSFEPKPAQLSTLNPPPSDSVLQALSDSRKITTFYSHQATAIQAIRDGFHVVVSTSTASGKSIIYQVPLLMALEQDPGAKAIFVYPTKVHKPCVVAYGGV